MAQLLGDEVHDVLLDLERLVTEDRLAQALGAVRDGAVLHPGAQAPPFGAGRAHFGGQVGLAQVGEVDRSRIPGQLARLLAETPDVGVLQLGADRIRVRERR